MILWTICDIDLDAADGIGGLACRDRVDSMDRVGVPDPAGAVPGSTV